METLRRLYLRLRYDPLLAFVLGGIIVGVIQQVSAELWHQGAVLALLGLLVAVVLAVLAYRSLLWVARRILPKPSYPLGDPPAPRKAMILLLGGGSRETVPFAVEHHRTQLEHAWFVVTDVTKPIGEELSRKYREIRTSSEDLLNHLSPVEAGNAVERAISHAHILGYGNADIICDVTGGTSAMTAGAIEASLGAGIGLQMVAGTYDEQVKAIRPICVVELKMPATTEDIGDQYKLPGA